MSYRVTMAIGAMLAGAAPALAGGVGCGGDCFRETTLAPVYGTVSERVLLSPPRTVDVVTPAAYATVTETVQVGGGRVWQVRRDEFGRAVGCWVDTPPVYETRPRTVMVSPAYSEPHTYPPLYGSRERNVLLEPGRRAWVPVGTPNAGAPGPFEALAGLVRGAADLTAGTALGAADLGLGAAGAGISTTLDPVGVAPLDDPGYDRGYRRANFGRSRYGNRIARRDGGY